MRGRLKAPRPRKERGCLLLTLVLYPARFLLLHFTHTHEILSCSRGPERERTFLHSKRPGGIIAVRPICRQIKAESCLLELACMRARAMHPRVGSKKKTSSPAFSSREASKHSAAAHVIAV